MKTEQMAGKMCVVGEVREFFSRGSRYAFVIKQNWDGVWKYRFVLSYFNPLDHGHAGFFTGKVRKTVVEAENDIEVWSNRWLQIA